MMSWVPGADDSPFPVENLPYGVFAGPAEPRRVGVAIGDCVLNLVGLDIPYADDFAAPNLNRFMARGLPAWSSVRDRLTELLTNERHRGAVTPWLHRLDSVRLYLPFEVADYVDFYASEHHASNVGRIFRPGSEPLTPNWKHLPIGYHGRAGTVVASGTEIHRPSGQTRRADGTIGFGPSQRLDIEAELGFVVGTPSTLGTPVGVDDFAEHVFGAILVNDWSARDIQAWEYVPLGPFLGKSFATSVSPWVVPLAALEAARIPLARQDPRPLPYLRADRAWALDIDMSVEWNGQVVARPPFASMYWTADQMLAHMTVNGASLRTGDLFASGTVSGPESDQRGSFLELTSNGEAPITLADGSARSFLLDDDVVAISATAPGASATRIGFGSVTGSIVAASGSTAR